MHLPVALHRHPRARRAHRDVELRVRLVTTARLVVRDRRTGTILATDCRTADSFLSRALGLIPRSGLAQGEALRITRTNAITMWFMRFPIDAVFVDRSRRVVKVAAGLRPWRFAVLAPGADEVIELPAGTVARTHTQVADELGYEAYEPG